MCPCCAEAQSPSTEFSSGNTMASLRFALLGDAVQCNVVHVSPSPSPAHSHHFAPLRRPLFPAPCTLAA